MSDPVTFAFTGREVRAVVAACGKQAMYFVKADGVYLCSKDEVEGQMGAVAYARGYPDPRTFSARKSEEQRGRQQAEAGGDDFSEVVSVEGWPSLEDNDIVKVELDKFDLQVSLIKGAPRPPGVHL